MNQGLDRLRLGFEGNPVVNFHHRIVHFVDIVVFAVAEFFAADICSWKTQVLSHFQRKLWTDPLQSLAPSFHVLCLVGSTITAGLDMNFLASSGKNPIESQLFLKWPHRESSKLRVASMGQRKLPWGLCKKCSTYKKQKHTHPELTRPKIHLAIYCAR